MSAAAPAVSGNGAGIADALRRFVRRDSWFVALLVLLVALLVVTKLIRPNYGSFDLGSSSSPAASTCRSAR